MKVDHNGAPFSVPSFLTVPLPRIEITTDLENLITDRGSKRCFCSSFQCFKSSLACSMLRQPVLSLVLNLQHSSSSETSTQWASVKWPEMQKPWDQDDVPQASLVSSSVTYLPLLGPIFPGSIRKRCTPLLRNWQLATKNKATKPKSEDMEERRPRPNRSEERGGEPCA